MLVILVKAALAAVNRYRLCSSLLSLLSFSKDSGFLSHNIFDHELCSNRGLKNCLVVVVLDLVQYLLN